MSVTVAAIQMKSAMGELLKNLAKAEHMVRQAAASGAELIALPELWNTGYHLERDDFQRLAEQVEGTTVTQFRNLAAELQTVLIVPFAEKGETAVYNSVAVIDATGRLSGVVRKTHLWGKEKLSFEPGDMEFPVFHTAVGKVGVLICYDAEFPEPARMLALQGAEILVVPSVWSTVAEPRWDVQLPARALDNTVFVLGVNTVERGSCGKSKLINPRGYVMVEADREREEILLATVDLSEIEKIREEIPYLKDYRSELAPVLFHEKIVNRSNK